MFDLIFTILQPLVLIKIVAIIFSILVLIFVLIAGRQIANMNDTISQGSPSKIVQLASYLNIILIFSLLLTAIVIL